MRATSGIGGTLTAAWGRWPRLSFRGLPTGRRKIFRSVMRFTLCSFGDELNSRSPPRGRRTHIGRGPKWTRLGYAAAGNISTSRRFRARQPTPRYCLTAGVRNLARAHSHRRKAARWDLAILVRYRPGRRPTIKCRVMFCEMVGSIAFAGALDTQDLRGVIGLSPSPQRTIAGVVGGFRRPNTWEDRIPAATSLSLAAGGWRCSKRLRSRCQRGVNSRYPLSCIRGD
jgi:hypothetical protein